MPVITDFSDPNVSRRHSVVLGKDGTPEQTSQGNSGLIVPVKLDDLVGMVDRNRVAIAALTRIVRESDEHAIRKLAGRVVCIPLGPID